MCCVVFVVEKRNYYERLHLINMNTLYETFYKNTFMQPVVGFCFFQPGIAIHYLLIVVKSVGLGLTMLCWNDETDRFRLHNSLLN